MTQLFVLAQEYREAANKLADLDMPPEVIEDTLDSLAGDLQTKCTNTAMLLRDIEESAAAMKRAEESIYARRKAAEARAARIKDYLLANMMLAGVQKIDSPYLRLCVRDNPPAVEVYEPGTIPAEFFTQPETPPPCLNKKALAEALKSGREIAGAKLTRGQRLDIK